MFNWTEVQAVDPKKSSRMFCTQNQVGDGCFFDYIGEVTEAARKREKLWCHHHGRECLPCSHRSDIFIAGFPCSPFSGQRPGRHSHRRQGTESDSEQKLFIHKPYSPKELCTGNAKKGRNSFEPLPGVGMRQKVLHWGALLPRTWVEHGQTSVLYDVLSHIEYAKPPAGEHPRCQIASNSGMHTTKRQKI